VLQSTKKVIITNKNRFLSEQSNQAIMVKKEQESATYFYGYNLPCNIGLGIHFLVWQQRRQLNIRFQVFHRQYVVDAGTLFPEHRIAPTKDFFTDRIPVENVQKAGVAFVRHFRSPRASVITAGCCR
jgi:hypothetical protein